MGIASRLMICSAIAVALSAFLTTDCSAVEIPKPVINIPRPNIPRPTINVPRPNVTVHVPKPVVAVPRVSVSKPTVNKVEVPRTALHVPKVDVPKAVVGSPSRPTIVPAQVEAPVSVARPVNGATGISAPKVGGPVSPPVAELPKQTGLSTIGHGASEATTSKLQVVTPTSTSPISGTKNESSADSRPSANASHEAGSTNASSSGAKTKESINLPGSAQPSLANGASLPSNPSSASTPLGGSLKTQATASPSKAKASETIACPNGQCSFGGQPNSTTNASPNGGTTIAPPVAILTGGGGGDCKTCVVGQVYTVDGKPYKYTPSASCGANGVSCWTAAPAPTNTTPAGGQQVQNAQNAPKTNQWVKQPDGSQIWNGNPNPYCPSPPCVIAAPAAAAVAGNSSNSPGGFYAPGENRPILTWRPGDALPSTPNTPNFGGSDQPAQLSGLTPGQGGPQTSLSGTVNQNNSNNLTADSATVQQRQDAQQLLDYYNSLTPDQQKAIDPATVQAAQQVLGQNPAGGGGNSGAPQTQGQDQQQAKLNQAEGASPPADPVADSMMQDANTKLNAISEKYQQQQAEADRQLMNSACPAGGCQGVGGGQYSEPEGGFKTNFSSMSDYNKYVQTLTPDQQTSFKNSSEGQAALKAVLPGGTGNDTIPAGDPIVNMGQQNTTQQGGGFEPKTSNIFQDVHNKYLGVDAQGRLTH